MERNVVILGKVGSGKKTLGNHIAGKGIFQPESALGTRAVASHYRECKREDMFYRIQTVDTGGLHTGNVDPMRHIKKFQTIHLIIFVIPNGRYTDESHRSLTIAASNLNERAKSHCVLIITGCENITEDEERRRIVDDFKDDARTLQVTALMGKGIFTVGFPDTSKMRPRMKEEYASGIERDETFIRQLVNDCKYGLDVNELQEQTFRQPPKPKLSKQPLTSSRREDPQSISQDASSLQRQASLQREEDMLFGKIPSTPQGPCREGTEGAIPTDLNPNVKTRTVVLLGAVGSGKRTLVNHIANQKCKRSRASTKNKISHCETFTIGGIPYKFLTIDVDNLHTQDPLALIRQTFQSVNLIVFVTAKGRPDDESNRLLMNIAKNLSYRAPSICALVITNCEGLEAEQREDIIGVYRVDDRFTRITAIAGKGIYAVGFPDESTSGAKSVFRKGIFQDEENLRVLVGKCDRQVPAASLSVETQQRGESQNPSVEAMES